MNDFSTAVLLIAHAAVVAVAVAARALGRVDFSATGPAAGAVNAPTVEFGP